MYKILENDYLESRKVLLLNNDLKWAWQKPKNLLIILQNAECDELLFIHEGKGTLKTFVGNLDFEKGDYLIIPRGTIYQVELETTEMSFFLLEAHSPIYTPKDTEMSSGNCWNIQAFCEKRYYRSHFCRTQR